MDPTGVPIPRYDQIVSLCFSVGIRKTRDEPYFPVPDLKVIPRGFMLCKVRSEPFVKGVYAINDPKDVRGTLVGADFKMMKKVSKEFTHRDPNSSLYYSNEGNYYFILPS